MAKYYGDVPCVNLSNTIHIVVSGTKCLCGNHYLYKAEAKDGEASNIIWGTIDTVTCSDCRHRYLHPEEVEKEAEEGKTASLEAKQNILSTDKSDVKHFHYKEKYHKKRRHRQ